MAIVKMSKFNLIAFNSQKKEILKSLQAFREVDFINIEVNENVDGNEKKFLKKSVNNEELTKIQEKLNYVDNALKLLKKYDDNKKTLKAIMEGNDNYTFEQLSNKVANYNWEDLCKELKILGDKCNSIQAQISKKYNEIEDYSVWSKLDINPSDLKKLKKVNSYLGYVPIKLKSNFIDEITKLEYTYYEELKITKEDVYYLIISHNELEEKNRLNEVFKLSSFGIIELNANDKISNIIENLKNEINELKENKREIIKEIQKNNLEIKHLEAVYDYFENKKLRIEKYENLAETKNIVAINGWIPTEKINIFEENIKKIVGNDYYVDYENAHKDDETVPIKLKNGTMSNSFEGLTGMYAYPKYNEIDPTPFITPFYILFFGMMGADVGYGASLLVGSILLLKLFNLNKKTKLFVQFFLYLSISVIFWGILYGSYFGMEIEGMWRLINPAKEYNKLLVGSVLFGIVHIYLGLGIKAYLLLKDKKVLDTIYDVLFWYMALTGGMLYLAAGALAFTDNIKNISGIISVIGMIGIVLTGGRDAKTIGGKLGSGLYALYGISSYVGDFVSYSRLMALGLSGGFIASAINMIAELVGFKGIGIIGAPLIFVLGHGFNMFLSFLGAYVHTSRLMYVEFFGKFYEGGGKPFKDFRKESKYVEIED